MKAAVVTSQHARPASTAVCARVTVPVTSIASIRTTRPTASGCGTNPTRKLSATPAHNTAPTSVLASAVRRTNTSGAAAAQKSGSMMNTESP